MNQFIDTETFDPTQVSDERLAQQIREELLQSPYQELRRLKVRVQDGLPSVSGEVTSFYLKQLTQYVLCQKFGQGFVIDTRVTVRTGPPLLNAEGTRVPHIKG